MTAAQSKMARAALGWSAKDLAREAGVGSATVERLERDRAKPIRSTVAAMRRALEAAGVEFLPGGAVRLRERAAADG